MIKRSLATVAVATTAALAPALHAGATTPTITKVSAPWVTLVPTDVSKTVSVAVTNPIAIKSVTIRVYRYSNTQTKAAALGSGTATNGTWKAAFSYSRLSSVGKWWVDVKACDVSGACTSKVGAASYYVRLDTVLVVNAYPEPVAEGTAITVVGRLDAMVHSGSYVPYAGKTIDIYFLPAGSSDPAQLMGSAVTDADGRYTKDFTAQEDGTWYARFAGTASFDAQWSKGDYIDVITSSQVKSYTNCAALRVDYPHGVGKDGAVDKTSGTPVTNFFEDTALYEANNTLDADGDGIACEA